ncbi:C-type lectin domain family 2 member D-like isoform X3 [Chrysemys picta bellii]|uniref:C-type lectin domain family 2 member D-like isoform X3 n=1 Tax=Chrysemys picta bellii TaxID=8478 RepID=UPI0032B25E57
MDPESQRAAASEIELLGVQHAPQGLQERGETEERFDCSGGAERVEKSKPPVAAPGPPAGPCCPEDWIGYRGKCYYFSETDGNWTYSQSQCSALNASLAAIDSEQEKDFLLRYKGFLDRWIGLQRKPGQPWRWPNGTEFDNRFPIRGGGDCVFLIDENWFGSSRCSTWRRWICSKSDPYTMGKKRAVELKL